MLNTYIDNDTTFLTHLRFKALRVLEGKSQKEWAELLEMPLNTWKSYESGQIENVPQKVFLLLRVKVKANVDWLKTGKGETHVF